MLYAAHRNANGLPDSGRDQWAIRPRTSPQSSPSPTAPAGQGFPWRHNHRRLRRTGRTTPTPTPPRRRCGSKSEPTSTYRDSVGVPSGFGLPGRCTPPVSAATLAACPRVRIPTITAASPGSRLAAVSARIARLRAPRRPYNRRAHRRQHLDHVAHQIIGCFTGIGHHDPAALRRQCRLQMLHPEPRQPVPMLHNDHPRIRVRQDPAAAWAACRPARNPPR